MNHWSEINGSIRSPERCENGTSWWYSSVREIAPSPMQLRDDRFTRLQHGHPSEPLGCRVCDQSVLADHADPRQPVAIADLEVVRVVPGGDLQRPCPEVGLHVVVGDDLQAPPDERKRRVMADEGGVTLVPGVHGDGRVRQHRLGAHGRDRDGALARFERVVDVVERVDLRPILDLEVRHGRTAARIPVDHVPVAVDVALLVQGDEHAQHGVGICRVEREPLVVVVSGRAEPLELVDDLAAVLLAPLPDPPLELLASEALACQPLIAE